MAQHNKLGKKGEKAAKAYLMKMGYQIRDVNWRYKHLEIDIIAQYEKWLVVIEVKTRSSRHFEEPHNAVTTTKIKNIVKATNEYILQNDWNGETRFDIITVIAHDTRLEIAHIEDAFLAPIE